MSDADELSEAVKRLDRQIRSLYQRLASRSWKVVAIVLPRSRAEVELTIEQHGIRILLGREKGEARVEVGVTGWTATYGVTTWRQSLSGARVDPSISGNAQAQMLDEDLDRIVTAINSKEVTQEALRATEADQARWAYQR